MEIDKSKSYELGKYKFVNFTMLDDDTIAKIREWRNHPDIRKVMYNTQEISIEGHQSFIKSLEGREDRIYWLVFRKDIPFGVMSLVDVDYEEESGELGYYLLPDHLESGLGLEFISILIEFIFTRLSVKSIFGRTELHNKNALFVNYCNGFNFNSLPVTINEVEYVEQNCTKEDFDNRRISFADSKRLMECRREFNNLYKQYSSNQ